MTREQQRDYLRRWRAKNRERYNRYMRDYYRRVRESRGERWEKLKATKRRQWKKGRDCYLFLQFMWRETIRQRKQVDPEFYAEQRRKDRERQARRRIRKGLSYVGKPSRRFPDWCVMGGGVDGRSAWLIENRTVEQRDYAFRLLLERKERRA